MAEVQKTNNMARKNGSGFKMKSSPAKGLSNFFSSLGASLVAKKTSDIGGKMKSKYSGEAQRADKVARPGESEYQFKVRTRKARAKAKKAAKASETSGKANTAASNKMKAAEKTYAKESMFKKAADTQDKAKTTPGKARSFKEAFDAATKAGKDRFMLKGKSYLTVKGKRADRFPVTTDKKSAATPKKSLREKLTGFKTQKGFEDAKDKRRIEKRIANIKKRKNAGKSFSAKNLKELEAKLAAN